MNITNLKEDLLTIKKTLPFLEQELEEKISSVQKHIDIFTSMDKRVEMMLANKANKCIKLNIGGKLFHSTLGSLLSQKDTLFYKLVLSDKFNLDEEIFIERNPRLFHAIIEYLRFKSFDISKFKKSDHFELLLESTFYNIPEIYSHFKNEKVQSKKEQIEFIAYEINAPYYSGSKLAGTNKVEDLSDKSCMKGICASSPGKIIIEFNDIYEFEEIVIGGWAGDQNIWASSNGNLAKIEVSLNKSDWENVGSLPSKYDGNIITVKLNKLCSGKYIKFDHNSYLGIGYLKINTI